MFGSFAMKKRFKLSKSVSRKSFSRNAGTHVKNITAPGRSRNPMRGGIRL